MRKIITLLFLVLIFSPPLFAASTNISSSSMLYYQNQKLQLEDGKSYTLYQKSSVEIEFFAKADCNGSISISSELINFSGPQNLQINKNERVSLRITGNIPKAIVKGKDNLSIIGEKRFLLFQVIFNSPSGERKNIITCFGIATTPQIIEAKNALNNLKRSLKYWTPKSQEQKEIVEGLYQQAENALRNGQPSLAKQICDSAMQAEDMPLAVIFSNNLTILLGLGIGFLIGSFIGYFIPKKPKEEKIRLREV